MKKILFFALAAAVCLTACNQVEKAIEEAQAPTEIQLVSVSNISGLSTKGYVAGATMLDNTYNALHFGDETPSTEESAPNPNHSWRDIRLSAYLTPTGNQTFASRPYFIDEIWRTDEPSTVTGGSAGSWKHHDGSAFVPVYWPMDGNLQFLAISMTQPLSGSAISWNASNPANGVTMTLGDKFLQDDVMYADCPARGSNNGAAMVPGTGDDHTAGHATQGPVPLTFRHTQAWIEFAITTDMANVVTIKDIVVENVYTRGDVTVGPVDPNANPQENVNWNFDREEARNFSMPDNYAASDTKKGYNVLLQVGDFDIDEAANANVKYFDVLLPKQNKTAFVVYYTLAGQDQILEYRYPLTTSATWNAGSKYVYQITFKPHEIVVDPHVVTFAGGEVGDFTPTTLE